MNLWLAPSGQTTPQLPLTTLTTLPASMPDPSCPLAYFPPLPLQTPGSGQRRCWLRGTVQSAGSPAQGLPVSGSKQRRCRYCSEASRVTEVGRRPDVFRRQCPSRAALEAGARALWGRQGPQGDHSDHPVRGRRPRWAKGLCWSRGLFSSESPVGKQEELRVMI